MKPVFVHKRQSGQSRGGRCVGYSGHVNTSHVHMSGTSTLHRVPRVLHASKRSRMTRISPRTLQWTCQRPALTCYKPQMSANGESLQAKPNCSSAHCSVNAPFAVWKAHHLHVSGCLCDRGVERVATQLAIIYITHDVAAVAEATHGHDTTACTSIEVSRLLKH